MSDAEKALAWLAKNPSHEVAYAGWDDDPQWEVHRVVGNRNDREWHLKGTGATPLAAILDAMKGRQP